MSDFARLREQLRQAEGIRFTVYDDANGKPIKAGSVVVGNPTIGIGRELSMRGLTEEEIAYLLDNDLADVLKDAAKFRWFDKLDSVRQNVVLEMLFNLGLTRFLGFKKFIGYMSEQRFTHAAEEMRDSRWYRQVGKRAERLRQMVITGQWP
jgi:lysozyme